MNDTSRTIIDKPDPATATRSRPKGPGLIGRIKSFFSNGGDASLRESLADVIEQHGRSKQEFSPEERSMLRNVLGFGEKRVDDVMVPRADITAVDHSIQMGELMAAFLQAGHSRLLVYRDTLDDPIGMVHIKDVLGWITAVAFKPTRGTKKTTPEKRTSKPHLNQVNLVKSLSQVRLKRDVLFVPPSMSAGDLLVKMQTSRCHMAVVVDEYGGTDGLVSIEDLVEEIVGEIEDEHDAVDVALINNDGEGKYIADARALIDDIAGHHGLSSLKVRDDDIETLGGLVFSLVGRVPVRGELIRHGSGIEFEVLEADLRRLKSLRIHLPGVSSTRLAAKPVKAQPVTRPKKTG